MNDHQKAILREIGLSPIWRLRTCLDVLKTEKQQDITPPKNKNQAQQRSAESVIQQAEKIVQATRTIRQEQDISHSTERRILQPVSQDWASLVQNIHLCRACALSEHRTQAVVGVGDQQAQWLFVGEGPGVEEDRKGEPFVGKSGQLLDKMLASIGLQRTEQVYIANAVKCRPPLNRTPKPEEIQQCQSFLKQQIGFIQPKLIVALGRPAAQALLQREVQINAVRGQVFYLDKIPVVVTYHPAYLLRNPLDKAKAWEDLCFFRKMMSEFTAQD